jgi:hypothetical protein
VPPKPVYRFRVVIHCTGTNFSTDLNSGSLVRMRAFKRLAVATQKASAAPLRKFQQALKIPALQLTETGDRYRILSDGDQKIMVAPAWLWLAGLP